MKKPFFLLGLLCCIGLGFGYGIEDPIQSLIAKLEKFRFNYPQEKVHLHLDKPYYVAGDSIWFKAYVVNAQDNVPTAISGILHVELINDRDSAASKLKVPLNSGLGWGQIALPDSLAEGNYRIRAYTDWMRNFDDAYFFDRTLRIGNTISNPLMARVSYTYSKEGNAQRVQAEIRYTDIDGRAYTGRNVDYTVELGRRQVLRAKAVTDQNGTIRVSFVNPAPGAMQAGSIRTRMTLDSYRKFFKTLPVRAASDSVDVQFFPEGGQLIDGQLSKVGFKAVQADGWGAVLGGYISTGRGEKLMDIRTEHAGMGSFSLLPKASEQYMAHLTFRDGSSRVIALPAVQPLGYGLSVISSQGDNLVVRISASQQLAGNGDAVLVAQSQSMAHYISKVSFTNNVITSRIPKNRFPGGILQLTLFNPAMQPVAERLVFIDYRSALKLSVSTDKQTYRPREQVRLSIGASAADTAVLGNFSVSVTDESKVPQHEDDEQTIFSNLLLSSDLRGFIEKPNYYFADTGSLRRRHLDNLMLTQGWRRFTWANVAAERFPGTAFRPSNMLNISGRVIWRGEAARSSKVNLFSNSGGLVFTDTLTDAEGRFRFDGLIFGDTTTFIVQARNESNRKNVKIEIDQEPAQAIGRNANAALIDPNLDISIYEYLKNSYQQYADQRSAFSIMLDPVTINRKRLDLFAGSANRNGAGNADKAFTREDFDKVPYMTIAQYLTGRGAGVMIRNDEAWLSSQLINGGPMTIFLDGMPVPQSMLTTLYTSHVKSIEVLRSPNYLAVYGVRSLNGVLVLTSRAGEVGRHPFYEYAPGLITYKPLGFSTVREFYSPNYHDPQANTAKADLRSTIYWNPFVNTMKASANLEYFNADGKGAYRVTVEGISSDGSLGRAVYRYNVK